MIITKGIKVYHDKCVRSEGAVCRRCVDACPMAVLGIKKGKIIPIKNQIKKCIGCYTCKSSCPTGLFTIDVREEDVRL